MAVSIDTCTALARFTGHFPYDTCERVCVPVGVIKPLPGPAETPTLGSGYGFVRVRVRVALENPRVTRDNHYSIAAPVPRAPIPDLDQSFHNRSHNSLVRPNTVHNSYPLPPRYVPTVAPDHGNLLLRTPGLSGNMIYHRYVITLQPLIQ